jgi:hypothetical protein
LKLSAALALGVLVVDVEDCTNDQFFAVGFNSFKILKMGIAMQALAFSVFYIL